MHQRRSLIILEMYGVMVSRLRHMTSSAQCLTPMPYVHCVHLILVSGTLSSWSGRRDVVNQPYLRPWPKRMVLALLTVTNSKQLQKWMLSSVCYDLMTQFVALLSITQTLKRKHVIIGWLRVRDLLY